MWNAIKIMIVFLDKNVARKQTNVNIKAVTNIEIVLDIKNVGVENVFQFASMYYLLFITSYSYVVSNYAKISA